MKPVRWTDEAVEDLESIRSYIRRDSPRYAQLVVERLVERVDRIAEFPEAGRVVPEFGQANLREVIAGSYRIVYRVRSDAVQVLTIFRSSMLMPVDPDELDR